MRRLQGTVREAFVVGKLQAGASMALLGVVVGLSGQIAGGDDESALGFEDLLALSRPAVAETMGLDAAKRAEVARLALSFQSLLGETHKRYPAGAQDAEGMEIRRELLSRLGAARNRLAEQLGHALSAEQRRRLAQLKPSRAEEKTPPSEVSVEEGRLNGGGAPPPATDAGLVLRVEYSKARLIDPATRQPVGAPLIHAEERLITCHAFSPNGALVATGTGKIASDWTRGDERGDEGEVRVWETATGRLVAQRRFPSYVTAITFLADGKTVRAETNPINGR